MLLDPRRAEAPDTGLLATLKECIGEQGLEVEAKSHADSIYAGAIGAAIWGCVQIRQARGARLNAEGVLRPGVPAPPIRRSNPPPHPYPPRQLVPPSPPATVPYRASVVVETPAPFRFPKFSKKCPDLKPRVQLAMIR